MRNRLARLFELDTLSCCGSTIIFVLSTLYELLLLCEGSVSISIRACEINYKQ